jgi:hypothetical protein
MRMGSVANHRSYWFVTKRIIARLATCSKDDLMDGGAGIRTQEAFARPTVFKTAPFDRSGTPPVRA